MGSHAHHHGTLHNIRMVFARETKLARAPQTKLAGGLSGLVAGALVSGATAVGGMAYNNMPSTAVGRNINYAAGAVANHVPSADCLATASMGAIDNAVTGGVEGPTYKVAMRHC